MFLSVDKSNITKRNHKNIKTNPNLYIGYRKHTSNMLNRIYPKQITCLGLTMYRFPLKYHRVNTPADLHHLHNTASRAQHKRKSMWSISQKNRFLDKVSFIQDNLIGVQT